MCFSPQRRTIFRHLNAEKCSETLSFLAFWLQNALFTTAAYNFWFSLWPPDSAFRDFSNIWRGCIFFLLTFVLLHLLSADLTTLLCFSTVHIVGSFYLNFLRWYLRCHVGDEMSNCIAKTCRTKLLGTPLLKTHRRVSAKCVTYSGTAWKFQQAQGNALLRWNVVCRYSSLKTHFQLTSSRTNFNTLHRKTSLWHEDSWDTTVWDNTDASGVNVSCCRTAWRYQQA